MTTLDVIKKQAKILQDFLNSNKPINDAISLSSCLQAIAKINGYKDWNTMKPSLIEPNNNLSTDNDFIVQFEELKNFVYELAGQHDALEAKVNNIEPYIDELKGIDPYNDND